MADLPITEPELKFGRFLAFLAQHTHSEEHQKALKALRFEAFMPLVATFVTPHYETLLAFRDKAVRTPPGDSEARAWAQEHLRKASGLVALALGDMLEDDTVKANTIVLAVRYLVYFVEIALIQSAHED